VGAKNERAGEKRKTLFSKGQRREKPRRSRRPKRAKGPAPN
jgi:hypothetical protein